MSDDDLHYRPPATGLDWLAALAPRTLLCVGEPADADLATIAPPGAELRTIDARAWSAVLRRGWYAYRRDGDWHALAVLAGAEPGDPESGRYRFTPDGHLVIARSLHEDQWALARHGADAPAFAVGDVVRPHAAPGYGRVRQVSPTAHGHRYRIEIDGMLRWYDETALAPVEGDPADPRFWLAQPPAGAAQLALTLTWTKLRHPLTDTLYSLAASKTLFRAYQFAPVLKLLSGSSGRLLIADEVGLGKTIEAGLIWSELEQRMPVQRALVVAPAPLTLKWKSEMERRFDRRLRILRPPDLAVFASSLERGEDAELHGIISLESLRTADAVLERLTELQPRLDLVIVDEAHDLRNRGTRSHAVGTLLADWADYLVLLSATPLNLGSDDLYHLVSLLDEGTFPDRELFAAQLQPNALLGEVARGLVVGQSPRVLRSRLDELSTMEFGAAVTDRPDYATLRSLLDTDIPLAPADVATARRLLTDLNLLGGVLSRTRKVDVPNAKAVREPRTIDVEWTPPERAFYDALREWYLRRSLAAGAPPGFATQMPLRQAASCIPAAQEVLRAKDPSLFATESDDVAEEVAAADLAGLDLGPLVRPITVDTKYDRLLEELLRARASGLGQMMIFSFFRATLRYLSSRLASRFTVRVMDGSVAMAEREQIMRDFRAGAFEVLLLSQVGAEGLDFEFCNVLVNYDMPWNPMEVEQRIGRLDRFGQTHEKIFIYNMRVPGTIETDIFGRLYDRIDLFHNSIGSLEPILRDADVVHGLLDPRLSPSERDAQIERLAVAAEARAQDLARLEQSRGVLAGIDSLLVDGLTADGVPQGRYIGPTEIATILGELLRRTDASMTTVDGHLELRGSRRLASLLTESPVRDGGSRHDRARLAAMLRDESPLPVTLSPAQASASDFDLLSSRHPLVRLALHVLTEESLALRRFGVASLPGLPPGRRYLVTVDLAATTGLRPLLELWATAVDVSTRALSPSAGEALLAALADGTLTDAALSLPADLVSLWELAATAASSRRATTEARRAADNEALVDGRIRAQLRSFDLKLARAAESLSATDPAVRRLTEGRVRTLRRRRDAVPSTLERSRGLTVTLTPVAVVLLSSPSS